MINNLIDDLKKSRTMRLSVIDIIVGGIVSAAPAAIQIFSSAPVWDPHAPLATKAIYIVTVASGLYKLFSGGYHAWLRRNTTGAIGENK